MLLESCQAGARAAPLSLKVIGSGEDSGRELLSFFRACCVWRGSDDVRAIMKAFAMTTGRTSNNEVGG